MKWISAATYASALAMVVALISQLNGWAAARAWFLLVWSILLLFVVAGLFVHPMRWPAWGLFVGFWGLVAALWLIVVQVLATADVLRQPAYGAWAAWPLAVLGIWLVVAAGLGFGNAVFPRAVDVLGILTGAGLFAIAVATWTGGPNAARPLAAIAGILYAVWVIGIGYVYWGVPDNRRMDRPAHI